MRKTPFFLLQACEREAIIKQVNHRYLSSTYQKNMNLKRYQPYLCKGYFIYLFVSSQRTMLSLIVDGASHGFSFTFTGIKVVVRKICSNKCMTEKSNEDAADDHLIARQGWT